MRRAFASGYALGILTATAFVLTSHRVHAARPGAMEDYVTLRPVAEQTRSPQQIGDVADMLDASCKASHHGGYARMKCVATWVEHFFAVNAWNARPDAKTAKRVMFHQLLARVYNRA